MLPSDWLYNQPPLSWPRLLGIDVGGSSPWAFVWAAVDPWHNWIAYHELYEQTSSTDKLIEQALPWMTHGPEKTPFQWKAKVIDYENKIAAEDLRRGGITVTNARKHDKAASIERLKSYIHPNPRHHFPPWHPRAGQAGSPRFFVDASCKNVRRELPQARWLEQNGITKDEMDRKTGNHTVDVLLYLSRELPPPMELPAMPPLFAAKTKNVSKMSEMYWYGVKEQEEKEALRDRSKRQIIQIPLF